MFTNQINDTLTQLIKTNPQFQSLLQDVMDDNKRTTSMLVHELRNPLSLLKGTIQYIEVKHPDVKAYKYWDQMEELVEDMERMMVDASLLNSCNSLNIETISFIDFMQGIVDSFMPKSISNGIDLSYTVQASCNDILRKVPCDPSKLKQVVTNLIKNAFEATTQGHYIKVDLSSSFTDNGDRKLIVHVSNNGLLIPEDEINKIFLPFITYKKGGTGVGLAISKRIIDLHYGTLTAFSKDDLTRFTITLPIDLLSTLSLSAHSPL